jgi:hypothetical protein
LSLAAGTDERLKRIERQLEQLVANAEPKRKGK